MIHTERGKFNNIIVIAAFLKEKWEEKKTTTKSIHCHNHSSLSNCSVDFGHYKRMKSCPSLEIKYICAYALLFSVNIY